MPIKTLYYKHNSQRIDALLHQLNPTIAEQVIHIGSPNSMIEVKEFVEQGGCVGLLGDRSFGGGRVVEVDFLGRPAPFPVWPMRLARAIKVPVFLFFSAAGTRNRGRRTVDRGLQSAARRPGRVAGDISPGVLTPNALASELARSLVRFFTNP